MAKNEYIDTIKPILYLLKFNGFLPIYLKENDNIPRFLTSRTVSIAAMVIYMLNIISQYKYLFDRIFIEIVPHYNSRLLLVLSPFLFMRSLIFMIPFYTWNKSKQLQDYWTKWEQFQIEYDKICDTAFISTVKKRAKLSVLAIISLTTFTQVIGQLFFLRGTFNWSIISQYFIFSAIFILAAYWVINCIYVRAVATDILCLAKKTLDGEDSQKMHEITLLWLTLCELIEQFNAVHSNLFLFYFILVLITSIIVAYSCTLIVIPHSEFINRMTYLIALSILIYIVLVICEEAYSVNKQLNHKHKETLLLQNTINMKIEMLYSVSHFLHTILVTNPEINLNGFLTLNRFLFPTILAVGINYLIVLRQFSSQFQET